MKKLELSRNKLVREIVIEPTGKCFDDALDLMQDWIKADPNPRWHQILRLAHGICIDPNGKAYAHAWVERENEVWQSGLVDGIEVNYSVDRAEFYEKLKAFDVTLYTLRELAIQNLMHGNYGPWKQQYRNLTKDFNP